MAATFVMFFINPQNNILFECEMYDKELAIETINVRIDLLVHGQVTIIFVVSVCLFVCLFVQSFSQPSLIRFRSN